MAATREVMSAADEPSPVLWTSARRTPVDANGGMDESECIVRGRFRLSS